jgi:hypothetical protein
MTLKKHYPENLWRTNMPQETARGLVPYVCEDWGGDYCLDEKGEKRLLSALAKAIRERKQVVKLCGKSYKSCNTCPYLDDCDSTRYYFMAIEDIANWVEK